MPTPSTTTPANSAQPDKILVWDIPTRLFHWLLVLLFSGLLITGLSDNLDWMIWHQRMGYAMLGLLIFRLLNGLFGLDYARFTHLPLHPASVKAYLSGQHSSPGHNPLGSWMVVAMLLVLTLQTFTGLLTSDDFFVEGPWVYWADEEWVGRASWLHSWNWIVMACLVGLHLLAILVYQFGKRQNLVKPMLSGYKTVPQNMPTRHPAAVKIPLWRLAAKIAIAGLAAWAVISLPG
ncbi:MAG: hypothetical protein GYB33_21135 [Gammaproteobacteria bacterium]|uniref:cytochrome b/b6 domain-containing protein n=1 Tax=Pseudomaricurvus alcaniphilus TaxID=1166482 RepID=UPI00140D344C|nr:hypothetical protein [Gammaproteobacteria bacterium]NHN36138.1 hypothetical protein [Pseudomaricurvus alcaniphilus]